MCRQVHRINEAIAAAGKRFDKAGRVRGIRQRGPQFGHGDVYSVVEVAKRFLRPNTVFQFIAGYDGARLFEKRCQYFKGLNLQPDSAARLAEFARSSVEFEDPEPRRPVQAGLHHPAPR